MREAGERMMITLKDVAARCGYSTAAVSKALNGRSDINKNTARQIREVARDMGYIPNTAARTLITNSSMSVGLLFYLEETTIWEHEYFAAIAASVQEVMEKEGFDIAPVNIARKSVVGSCADYCRHRNYDGALVMSVDNNARELTEFVASSQSLPMVMIDAWLPDRSAVISDNYTGARDLIYYAYLRGHRRIAFIYGDENTIVTQARLKGVQEACRDLFLTLPAEYLLTGGYRSPEKTAEAFCRLMTLPQPPTCILCPDDYAALGAYNQAQRMGLSIPQDVSLIGYDGIPLAQVLSPRLTTLRQDSREIGRQAAQLLLGIIRDPRSPARQIYLPGTVVEGESVSRLSRD